MRRKPYPLNVLARANKILAAWELIGTSVAIGSINQRGLTNDIAQVKSLENQVREAEIHLSNLRNQRDTAYVSLWQKIKRICDGVKGLYGDDSIEYELIGRTRASKRKPYSRKQGPSQL